MKYAWLVMPTTEIIIYHSPVNPFIVLTRVFSSPKFSTEPSKSRGSALITSSGVGHLWRNMWIFGIASFAKKNLNLNTSFIFIYLF